MSKTVMLFSGGMDSYAIACLTNPDLLLYCFIGLPEQVKEVETIDSLPLPAPLKIDSRLALGDQKLPNEIVPMRNLFFAMVGAYYAPKVILGATAGDTTPDKDLPFATMTTSLLRHVFSVREKNPLHLRDESFSLLLPYKDKTKTEIVAEYLAAGLSPENLVNTRSCYSSGDKECGVCRSCVRKYTALAMNGIDCHGHFTEDPRTMLASALSYAMTHGRANEIDDLRTVMTRNP